MHQMRDDKRNRAFPLFINNILLCIDSNGFVGPPCSYKHTHSDLKWVLTSLTSIKWSLSSDCTYRPCSCTSKGGVKSILFAVYMMMVSSSCNIWRPMGGPQWIMN